MWPVVSQQVFVESMNESMNDSPQSQINKVSESSAGPDDFEVSKKWSPSDHEVPSLGSEAKGNLQHIALSPVLLQACTGSFIETQAHHCLFLFQGRANSADFPPRKAPGHVPQHFSERAVLRILTRNELPPGWGWGGVSRNGGRR